ncbi:hypothetical protein WT26_02420 [Burkholderia cepacia]|uniref:Uncharacterized protein n=1 Tax=Burkholderia cepacia TaxID=292 RepID=A0A1B4PLT7_BURCE|nr:hypothetical protein WT26_02420 [Burkholderia cepacia]
MSPAKRAAEIGDIGKAEPVRDLGNRQRPLDQQLLRARVAYVDCKLAAAVSFLLQLCARRSRRNSMKRSTPEGGQLVQVLMTALQG